jgi:hypothetical protein
VEREKRQGTSQSVPDKLFSERFYASLLLLFFDAPGGGASDVGFRTEQIPSLKATSGPRLM